MTSCIQHNSPKKNNNQLPQFNAIHRCGLLMLIDHLISTSHSSHKKLKIAQSLLQNFHKMRVAINPPDKNLELNFINHIINQALLIPQNPPLNDIQQNALNLLSSLKIHQQNPSNSSFQNFELHWKEFTLSYLNSKLTKLLDKK